jgi:glycosyltransferase involved in cell wall biosynthesis
VRDVPEAPTDEVPANGEGIEFIALPDFTGSLGLIRHRLTIAAAARAALRNGDAVMLRAPAVVGDCLLPQLRRTGRPFGVEVVADPYDSFGTNAMHHPLRLFFRWLFARNLRRQCAGACGAAYVTEHALQRRYPPAPEAFATHYSSIDLPRSAFVKEPRTASARSPLRLLMVGTLAQLYKAPDILIDAVAELVRGGLALELTIVGGGQHLREMEERAASQGLRGIVHFTGNLSSGQAVRAELDRADLFTMPSRQEGLPRAMIEAMARGLPAIGSTVGGIPELLPDEDLVPPNDVAALAAKIREMVTDPGRMARAAERNLAKAREYSQEVLTPRRQALYTHVRARTEEWLRKKGVH